MADERIQWWVRLATSVASSIVAAAIIWLAASVNVLQRDTAVLVDQVQALRADVKGIYTQSDADRDFGRIRRTLTDHEKRLRRLEGAE